MSSVHSRETHAYPRRVESDNKAPSCTNSTVLVDVIYAESPTPSVTAVDVTGTANDEGKDVVAIDHVYEEVGLFNESEDVLLYCREADTSKTDNKITTLLPSHKICAQCLKSRGSPVVYSDRLIYGRQKISAMEAKFFQELSTPEIYFRYNFPGNNLAFGPTGFPHKYFEDYMPVSNLTKANASSILFAPSVAKDVFDLDSSLGPGILLLNGDENRSLTNTQVYHRFAGNCYSRISEIEARAPMVFRVKTSRMFSTIKSTGYDENMIYWMNYDSDVRKHREVKNGNRSSLLLLEPLLLMPELANTRQNPAKNRITQSERVKIVRMVIAYTLSFFLLAIVTFYIVYFT